MILCLHCSNISFSKAGTSVLIIGFISQVPSTVPAHQRCSVFVKWVNKWDYESLSKHLTVVKVVINYYTWLNSIIKCTLFSFNIIHSGFSVFSTDFFMKSQELVKKTKTNKRKSSPLTLHFNSDTQLVPTRKVASLQNVALMWFIAVWFTFIQFNITYLDMCDVG